MPDHIICKEQVFFMDKKVYDVYVEFMNAKTCTLTIASKISWLYLESDNVL